MKKPADQDSEKNDANDQWGNFSDLNNTNDMAGTDSARSGFSEFDGRQDGNILNAIKQANIMSDDIDQKDIDDADFEIDPVVGKKQRAQGKQDALRQGVSGLNNLKTSMKDDDMKSEYYEESDENPNALD